MLDKFLIECWLSHKELQLYKICLKLWKSTASTIADMTNRERTSTYKMLTNMAANWFLYTQKDNNTTYFLPISIWSLKDSFDQKSQNISYISQNYELVTNEYNQIKSPYDYQTTINIYEWISWIKRTFDFIYDKMDQDWLLIAKCIASQTFDSMVNENFQISYIYSDFLQKMKNSHKVIHSYLWQWISIMESVLFTNSYENISNLPNSNNSSAIYIVADNIFMIIYSKSPKIIHITSNELANLFYFMLDSLSKNKIIEN